MYCILIDVTVFALYASVQQRGGGSQKMIYSFILSNSLYMTQLLNHLWRNPRAHLHSTVVTSSPVVLLFVPSIFRSWETSCGASPQRASPHCCHRTPNTCKHWAAQMQIKEQTHCLYSSGAGKPDDLSSSAAPIKNLTYPDATTTGWHLPLQLVQTANFSQHRIVSSHCFLRHVRFAEFCFLPFSFE